MITEYLLQIVACVLAMWGFSVLFYVPRKQYGGCMITGTVGWIVYYALVDGGIHKILACLIAAFVVTELARVLAVAQKVPSTIFLVIGIFPLVPGTGVYYTAYYVFMKNPHMAGIKGLETLEASLAIVGGIILGSTIPKYIIGQKKR